MKKLQFLAIIAISLIIVSACNNGNNDNVVQRFLIDYQEVVPTISPDVDGIKEMLTKNGQGSIADKVQYNIKIYKITYKTYFLQDSITASGLVAVPIPESKKDEFSLLSYQHGTLIRKLDAPSVNYNNEFITYIASTGMVVAIPDYIGFGASQQVYHPYMVNEYTTNAVLDMIRATKELIGLEKEFSLNGRMFMYGYSQGASATLGSLKAIENNALNNDLSVTAAVCGAGAYDLAEMRKWILKQNRYEQPVLVAYMLKSYAEYENVSDDFSLVFNNEVASTIPPQLDGSKDLNTINGTFGTFHVGELFNDNFESDSVFEDATGDYTPLVQAFSNNKLNAWSISTSLSIHYGSEDLWIPGDQSLSLYKEFQNNGSGVKVKLERFDGLNHATAFPASLTKALNWFLSFNQD